VTAAHYQEEAHSWDVTLEDGRHYGARYLITAIGMLSAQTMPRIAGVDTSRDSRATPITGPRNRSVSTANAVVVIGTGATAVQNDPGSGQDRRPANRVPAHPELVRAIA
jgi:cation diffusion facilitator CzcD-associated flavoprotein CzcO